MNSEITGNRNTNLHGECSIPDWCEISLDSENEQELRGRLRFRNNSEASGASISPGRSSPLPSEELEKTSKQENKPKLSSRPSESLAYQLGMMVFTGAAKVVNNVADGARRERDAMKQLHLDLDDMKQKYEALDLELENSKQWIAYYENVKKSLENQLEETNKRLDLQHKSMQEKILKSEAEAENCRKEVANALQVKTAMMKDIEEARNTIDHLSYQIEESQKAFAEGNRSAPSGESVCSQSVQVNLQEISSPPEQLDSPFPVQLRMKERQLADATKALSLAHARGDKLRQQLMSSLDSMKSQTYQMKTCRAALEVALNDNIELKELLQEEMQKSEEKEQKLRDETLRHTKTSDELLKQKRFLKEAKSLAFSATNQLKQTQVEAHRAGRAARQAKLDLIAERVVSNVISSAVTEYFQQFYFRRFNSLRDKSQVNAERAEYSSNLASKLQEKMDSLELEIKYKEACLEQCKSQISTLLVEKNKLMVENSVKTKAEIGLKDALIKAESNYVELKIHLESNLHKKCLEMQCLNSQVHNLREENTRLKITLENTFKPTSVSVVQTSVAMTDIDTLYEEMSETTGENEKLRNRLESSQECSRKFQAESDEYRSQVERQKDEIDRMERINLDLRRAFDKERRITYTKHHYLSRSVEDCRRLDWACKKQHNKLVELQRENSILRRYVEGHMTRSRSAATGLTKPFESSSVAEVLVENNFNICRADADLSQSQYILERGDAKIKKSNASCLDTIPEASERSSSSSVSQSPAAEKQEHSDVVVQTVDNSETYESCSSSSRIVTSNTEKDVVSSYVSSSDDIFSRSSAESSRHGSSSSEQHTDSEESSNANNSKDIKQMETTRDQVDDRDGESPAASILHDEALFQSNKRSPAGGRKSLKSRKIKLSKTKPKDPSYCLPIWRRENKLHSELDSLATTSSKADMDDRRSPCKNAKQPACRQIGLPMSEKTYKRLMHELRPSTARSCREMSLDDGYSSSTHLDESQTGRSSETTTPRTPSVCIMAQSEHDGKDVEDSDTDADEHYFVTFAGVTFDLVNFSVVKMHQVTASCAATRTSEGMIAFVEFLAQKAEELENDPYWKGKHNLGRPEDWRSLKSCYM